MEIPAEFFHVSFNKAMAFGYKTDDVDEFVTSALALTKRLQEENEVLQQKLEVLAASLGNYREEEDSLRSALIGAQKLGDSILKDSRNKAEIIIRDATVQAEKREKEAEEQCSRQQYELEKLQLETAAFKEKLFALYRTHLDIIKNIPAEYDKIEHPAVRPSPPAEAEQLPEQQQPPSEQPEQYMEEQAPFQQDNLPEDDTLELSKESTDNPQEERLEAESNPQFNSGFDEDYEEDYPTDTQPPDSPIQQEPQLTEYLHEKPKAAASPFSAFSMVQLEFENDDLDDDDFAAEKQLLHEASQNKTPYLDEDEDEFTVPLTGKKKLLISEKFGELKFGDSFNLRDD